MPTETPQEKDDENLSLMLAVSAVLGILFLGALVAGSYIAAPIVRDIVNGKVNLSGVRTADWQT